MQPYQTQSKLFKVLMHPTRLAILEILRDGEQCVCHMEAFLDLRQAYISQHLMILRDAGLVSDRREGWNIFYRVNEPGIYAVIDAMNLLSEAASGEGAPAAKKTRKNIACPCPKCNPGVDAIRCDLPLGGIKNQT